MSNLLTSLNNSTNALSVYADEFNTIQNNITNANTPGYVKQDLVLVSQPFDIKNGLPGGVTSAGQFSARSAYLEQAVRNQQELAGYAGQKAADLKQAELPFDLTSQFGVPGALNDFFNGFSQLSVNPNDAVARQGILNLAKGVAQSFQQSASGLTQVTRNVDQQTGGVVDGINRLASKIADINHHYRSSSGSRTDAGLDAQLNSALEELSGLTNFTLVRTADGAANVYLGGGQSPLVLGDSARPISADLSGPTTVIRDAQGNDVTSLVTRGKLGALLEEKNTLLPGYMGDLNTLAANFADQINAALANGVDQNGNPPAQGLFTYDNATGAAFTLAVNPLTPDQIAAALPTAPGGNGNAIAIAQLASQPTINGFSFTQYYGNLGGRVGRDVATADAQNTQFQDTLTQARANRSQESGVSLDEEAAKLLQFQQAYQAVGKLVQVLDDLTQTVMGIIQ